MGESCRSLFLWLFCWSKDQLFIWWSWGSQGSLNPQSQAPNTDGWTSLEEISKATSVAPLLSIFLREDNLSVLTPLTSDSERSDRVLNLPDERFTVVFASYTGSSTVANTVTP